MRRKLPGWRLYAVVFAVALTARGWYFIEYCRSPLRHYHLVPGLDMQSMLEFSELFLQGQRPFTPFFLVTGLLSRLAGPANAPWLLALVQHGLGIGVALLVTWLAVHIFRNRPAAWLAGILAALYSPPILYESMVLQESFVIAAFWLSAAGWLWARKRRFHSWQGALAGTLLGLATIGRPTALLWAVAAILLGFLRQRPGKRFRGGLPLLGGCLGFWLLVSVFNLAHSGSFFPFYRVFGYAATVNAPPESPVVTPEKSDPPAPLRIGINALCRSPLLLIPQEIPENLNYHFLEDKIPSLKWLPGPVLLLPLAAAGILLLVLSGCFRKREGLILLWILLLALPLSALYPIGRYRLLLYPALALLSAYPLVWVERPGRVKGWKRKTAAFASLAGGAAVFLLPFAPFFRSTDYVAWGIAAEGPGHLPTDESMASFAAALVASEGRNQSAAVNLLVRLLVQRKFDAVETIANAELNIPEINPLLMLYYRGLARLGKGDLDAAEADLKAIPPALTPKRDFYLGEIKRLRESGAGKGPSFHEGKEVPSPPPHPFPQEKR